MPQLPTWWCDWLSCSMKVGMLSYKPLIHNHHSAHNISVTLFPVQQENAIQTMELRNYFSLFCVHQESQLIFAYLPITSRILGAFVNSQVQSHREVRIVGYSSYMMWTDRGKMREQWKTRWLGYFTKKEVNATHCKRWLFESNSSRVWKAFTSLSKIHMTSNSTYLGIFLVNSLQELLSHIFGL